jgi:3-phosphoglycerate kinase
MKKIKDFSLKGKNVLLRCDFNVPLSSKGDVLDNFRIKSVLPTIKYLQKQGARIILMGHLEKKDETYSFKLLIPEMTKIFGEKPFFISDYLKEDTRKKIKDSTSLGQIILLENLRFHQEEKENNQDFAKAIARLGDVYINDAFSVCHRSHASIVGIPKYLPSTAGLLLEKELKNLSRLLKNPDRPFVAIIGGIKIKTKGKAVLNALKIADYVLVGSKIGEYIFNEKDILQRPKLESFNFFKNFDLKSKKIIYPIDGIFAYKKDYSKTRIGLVEDLKKDEDILDIGPKTIEKFKEIINSAKTILWSGAIGMYEKKDFEKGTKAVAEAIKSNQDSFSVAGGGETISFIKKFKLSKEFDFLSTGGGAMLGLLSEKKLPGIKALKYYD